MLTHHLIPLNDRKRWQDALNKVPHGAAHTHAYNAALALSHPEEVVLYVGTDEREDFYTLCPLKLRPIQHWVDVATPYGLSGFTSTKTYPHFNQLWQEFCQRQSWICGYILQHPFFSAPGVFPYQEERSFLFLNLEDSLESIFQNFSPTHRYEIRKFESHISLITNEKSDHHQELTEALFDLYKQTLQRTQANPLYHYTQATLLCLLNNPIHLVVGARHKGKIVALSVFLRHGKVADYFLNASTQEGRIFSKNLIWWGCQILKERGVNHLNLGGGIREGDALENFKRRFGARPLYPPILKLIFNQDVYVRLSPPSVASSFFPPYREGYHVEDN